MVRSMTGFGRAEGQSGGTRVTVEIRSVNHRFLEITTRLPRRLAALENPIRERLQGRVVRGKVHVGVQLDEATSAAGTVALDAELAARYVELFRDLREQIDIAGELDVATLAGLPEVITRREEELTADEGWKLLEAPLGEALDDFDAMRLREGEALATDLRQRLAAIREATGRIEVRNPEVVARVRERLRDRLEQISKDVEYNRFRLEAELTLFAERTDITEESVRLKSHLDQFTAYFDEPEPAGRRLNFLLQEMNREANTIGSKCQHLDVTRDVIFVREEIEKIRQQIQNIE